MQGIAKYRTQRVHGATPGELVVLLLETASSRLSAARDCMESGQRMAWIAELAKVRPIYLELIMALDHTTAPELTRSLHLTYAWAIQRLGEVGKSGEVAGVESIIKVNDTLLGAFRQVVMLAPPEAGPAAADPVAAEPAPADTAAS